jgi:hypothetical protein
VDQFSAVLPTWTRLAAEQQYDAMRRNVLEAAKLSNWHIESRKLLEIYQSLSYRFDDRITSKHLAEPGTAVVYSQAPDEG